MWELLPFLRFKDDADARISFKFIESEGEVREFQEDVCALSRGGGEGDCESGELRECSKVRWSSSSLPAVRARPDLLFVFDLSVSLSFTARKVSKKCF